MNTVIISAFPACGKSYVFENEKKIKVLDSDSSQFSWRVDGSGQKVRDENFPGNYIQHIKDNLGKADVIFVSSHLQVREAMAAAGLKFVTVYPEPYLK